MSIFHQNATKFHNHNCLNQRDDQKSCCYCDWTTKGLNVENPTWKQLKNHIEFNHPEHAKKKNLLDRGRKCDICFLKVPPFRHELRKHKNKDHQRLLALIVSF